MVPSCGVPDHNSVLAPTQASHPVSADGSLVFFVSQGNSCPGPAQLYMRDLGGQQTKLLSGPALSGPSCGADLIKAIPGAAFFFTATRLSGEDSEPASCSEGGDVYRYEIATGELDCVTCVVAG